MSDDAFPIVTVRDLDANRRVYEPLGFAEGYRFPPEQDAVFITMERTTSTIGIGSESWGDDDDRFAYWVYVDNVDATVAMLREAGATVLAEPEDQPWGERIARVRDPEGTVVVLGAKI